MMVKNRPEHFTLSLNRDHIGALSRTADFVKCETSIIEMQVILSIFILSQTGVTEEIQHVEEFPFKPQLIQFLSVYIYIYKELIPLHV